MLRNRWIGQHLEKFEAAYPKLKAGGGFEILRSGIGNNLAFCTTTRNHGSLSEGSGRSWTGPGLPMTIDSVCMYVCMYVIYRIFDKPVCCCTNTVRNAFLFWCLFSSQCSCMNTSSTKMHDMRTSWFESLDFARLEANMVSVFQKKTDVAELPEEKQIFPCRSDGKTGKPTFIKHLRAINEHSTQLIKCRRCCKPQCQEI